MNYEKAYKEALERAKESLKDGTISSNTISYIEEIFPELKESEDEQHRKWILEYLYDGLRKSDEQFKGQFKCAIAWLEKQYADPIKEYWRGYREGMEEILDKYAELEKQGEQKPTDKVEPKFNIGDTIWKKTDHSNRITILSIDEYFYYANSYNILIVIADKEWELVEQKSADKVEPKFKVGDKIQYLKGCGTIMTIEKIENGEYIFANNLGHTTIEDGNKWYLVERNPTWSEEDENAMWLLKDIVRHSNEINEKIYTMPLKEKLYDWLKSLKDRVQPKQEWNKEDEDILNTIINHFKIDLECTENDDIIRWLKSLRPQNKWKPSDEQLDALQYVCRNLNPPPYDKIGWNSIKTLELICQDLKKLKE